MRVLYYAVPWFMDVAAPFIAAMSRLVELSVLLEISPLSWRTSMFDLEGLSLPRGITAADAVLSALPPRVRDSWSGVRDFRLAVYDGVRAYHPSNALTGIALLRHLPKVRPDVVHLEGYSGRLAWAVPGLAARPVVLSVHDPRPHLGEGHWRKSLVRRATFASARRIVLHNQAQMPAFCREYGLPPERVEAIPLGLCDAFRTWGADENDVRPAGDEMTVLFYGRLSPYKGLEDLFRAIEIVHPQLPRVHFVVAGRPIPGYQVPTPPRLPDGILDLRPDYISNTELASLMRRAAVVVCPYREATQSAVVLTAYAFGRPVIATNVGGLPEYVRDGETGILIPPGRPDALAAAIIRFFAEEDREHWFRGIARLAEGELSWANIAKRTVGAYQRTLGAAR